MANDAVPMEIDLLNEQLCPIMPWPVEDCKTGVATWWPSIAMRVFDRAVAPYICGPDFIGSCTERPPPKYVHTYLVPTLNLMVMRVVEFSREGYKIDLHNLN